MPHGPTRSLLPTILFAVFTLAGCKARLPVSTEPFLAAGQGTPVVVFDAGFGETRQTWQPIFPAIAAETTAFAFERPGYRMGPATNLDPTGATSDGITTLAEQALHLHTLLAAAKLPPPYVLVGHSLGGTMLLGFAKRYPKEVAGIVFVDGRMPTFTAACQAAGFSACVMPRESITAGDQFLAEYDGFLATETTEAATMAELGDIPATFIVATRPGNFLSPTSVRLQREWINNQRASAESMRDSRYVEATGAGHYIHEQQPELVITEIKNMLTRARTGAWPKP